MRIISLLSKVCFVNMQFLSTVSDGAFVSKNNKCEFTWRNKHSNHSWFVVSCNSAINKYLVSYIGMEHFYALFHSNIEMMCFIVQTRVGSVVDSILSQWKRVMQFAYSTEC